MENIDEIKNIVRDMRKHFEHCAEENCNPSRWKYEKYIQLLEKELEEK